MIMQLGSGTDPVEGGSLAAALLEWLLPRVALTFCTSHHAELKELSVSACPTFHHMCQPAYDSLAVRATPLVCYLICQRWTRNHIHGLNGSA